MLFLSGLTQQVEALHLTAQAALSLRMVIKSAHSVFHEDKLSHNKKLCAEVFHSEITYQLVNGVHRPTFCCFLV